jgi:hypothetical protein
VCVVECGLSGVPTLTRCTAWCWRCIWCAAAAAPPLVLPGRPPPAADQVRRMTVWLAGCVPAGMARLPCCCATPVMGAFTCAALGCVAGVRLLAIGSARAALAHILPLLATRAAARGPMALALRPCTIPIIIIIIMVPCRAVVEAGSAGSGALLEDGAMQFGLMRRLPPGQSGARVCTNAQAGKQADVFCSRAGMACAAGLCSASSGAKPKIVACTCWGWDGAGSTARWLSDSGPQRCRMCG